MNGIIPKLSGVNTAIVESDLIALITNADMIVPIRSVPPSPINILDAFPNTL